MSGLLRAAKCSKVQHFADDASQNYSSSVKLIHDCIGNPRQSSLSNYFQKLFYYSLFISAYEETGTVYFYCLILYSYQTCLGVAYC